MECLKRLLKNMTTVTNASIPEWTSSSSDLTGDTKIVFWYNYIILTKRGKNVSKRRNISTENNDY